VKTALAVGAVVVALVLNFAASWKILSSEVHTPAQKAAWLLLVWLAPALGAIWALQVSTERTIPAPVAGSFEQGSNLPSDIGGSGLI
jgi:hypothetical protein